MFNFRLRQAVLRGNYCVVAISLWSRSFATFTLARPRFNANGALLMSSANPQSLAGRVCFCLLLFAIGLYLLASIREIDRDLKQDSDWRTYFTKDAMHYHVAAEAFASGDFSMSYEKGWPYRQPLFPLLIAGVMKATNDNLLAIRMINVGVIVFAAITLFRHPPSLLARFRCGRDHLDPFRSQPVCLRPIRAWTKHGAAAPLFADLHNRLFSPLHRGSPLDLPFAALLRDRSRLSGSNKWIVPGDLCPRGSFVFCFKPVFLQTRAPRRHVLRLVLRSFSEGFRSFRPQGEVGRAGAPLRPFAPSPIRCVLVALPHRRARLGYYHRAKLALAFALFR